QTNDVGRAAALLPGFLLVARETGLPLRLLELGASAGLNLHWDRFRYESSGAAWGDPTSPVRLLDCYAEGTPPLGTTATVVDRSGCDTAPLDPRTADGRLTLRSFIWPDQPKRAELLEQALTIVDRVPAVTVEGSSADAWLDRRLHVEEGMAVVVFHSMVVD